MQWSKLMKEVFLCFYFADSITLSESVCGMPLLLPCEFIYFLEEFDSAKYLDMCFIPIKIDMRKVLC